MGRTIDSISPPLREWIERQPLFFVATAPSGDDGHVNLSPKGLDTFRVLDEHTVAYLDLTGSGAETIAHLRQNGRITVMFCAFEGQPRIFRIHGTGEVLRQGDAGFEALSGLFPDLPGARSIIKVTAERLSTSCGFAVPLMTKAGDRDALVDWAAKKGADGIEAYWTEKNAASIDGLPAIDDP